MSNEVYAAVVSVVVLVAVVLELVAVLHPAVVLVGTLSGNLFGVASIDLH